MRGVAHTLANLKKYVSTMSIRGAVWSLKHKLSLFNKLKSTSGITQQCKQSTETIKKILMFVTNAKEAAMSSNVLRLILLMLRLMLTFISLIKEQYG